jgi:predicted aspartyl protease
MPYAYDTAPAWPFPVLTVVIHQIGGEAVTSPLPALLDTGADITLVPLVQLRAIQADETYTARLRGHWGESRPVTVHLVDLEVAGHRLPAVEVVADDLGQDVLLGRNVINKLILLLDGPRAQTDVLSRRQVDRLGIDQD